MRIIWILLLSIILFSCREPKKDYPIPNKKDINEIVKVIVVQDSLYLDSLPLCVDLGKIVQAGPLWSDFSLDVKTAIDSKRPNHFKKADSLYLVFQINNSGRFKIDTMGIPTLFTSIAEREKLSKEQRRKSYFYQMSTPLFSSDQKQAYVQLKSYYDQAAWVSYMFVLKKINSKWVIVMQGLTGMS